MSDSPILTPAMAFLGELETHNTKEFFERERARYDAARSTFLELCAAVDGFGDWRVYRAHNDRRFRPDADPYKTFLGAVAERPDGVGAVLQVRADGVLVGSGIPMPAPDQLTRLREAVADAVAGPRLVRAIEAARARGITVHGGRWDPLRRVPRGFPADSARADLLRWKGVEANVRVHEPTWSTIGQAARSVTDLLLAPTELHTWLGRHVGPSSMTAEERFAPRRRRA
jgi:uncharacterized protein (DUF2461 family)